MATQKTLQTSDGNTLAIQDWPLEHDQIPRGLVILVHGLGEHMGRYAEVVQQLNQWGFSARAYDQYGHGQSSGARGRLPSDYRLLEDLDLVIKDARQHMSALNTQTPLIVLGHSMGGLVVARFVSLHPRAVDALVLSSPALGIKLNVFQKLLLAIMPKIAPNLSVNNGLKVHTISHDQAVIAAYLADPLVHNRVSPRLARFIAEEGPKTLALASTWSTPTLLMFAGEDQLVDPNGSRDFAAAAPKPLIQATGYESLYHEIFNEVDPAPVFVELKAWLDTQFPVQRLMS